MVKYENIVAKWIKEKNDQNRDYHVLYRVTPIYEGENKLATGVQIEAKSVEEEGVCFNKFIYNVQDNFEIDYSKGEIFLVTNKYENDYEYHRYKVAQYIEGHERKYIAFEKNLPENVKLGDIVRKIDGKYIYDKQATQYIKNSLNEMKQDIIDKRD